MPTSGSSSIKAKGPPSETGTNMTKPETETSGYIQAFSFGWVYDFYKGTRCKPWDNRELDALDGIRAKAFVLYTIS